MLAGAVLAAAQVGAILAVAAGLGLVGTPAWGADTILYAVQAFCWGAYGSTLTRTTLGAGRVAPPPGRRLAGRPAGWGPLPTPLPPRAEGPGLAVRPAAAGPGGRPVRVRPGVRVYPAAAGGPPGPVLAAAGPGRRGAGQG